MLFAVPNGGKRNRIEAAIMQGEGVKSGVPDLIMLHPSGQYHGLAIEMKRKEGGKVSPAQKEWIDNLNAEGYCAVVCHGAESAIFVIKEYLNPPRIS